MYEAYYHFRAKPFQLSPDPRFFFSSRGHRRAMAYLEYGVHQGEGFIVITGEIGAGKTMLARTLARKLESQNVVMAQVVSTQLEADDIVRMVAAAFDLPNSNTKAALLKKLEQFLLACHTQGKRALLVVDEAQNLPPESVEELRMLSNYVCAAKEPLNKSSPRRRGPSKRLNALDSHLRENDVRTLDQSFPKSLLQIFLLGQPEFRRTLQSPAMEQLSQRIIASCHLGPMDGAETEAYIVHRLQTVGWRCDPSFSEDAFAAIHQYTGGIPRKINILCDRLLLMGRLDQKHAFTGKEVAEVIDELQEEFAPATLRPN